jgi:uncharacterized protein (DUF1684 family)
MRLVFVFLAFVLFPFTQAQAQVVAEFNHEKYDKQIKNERAIKDVEMVADEHSPIPEDEKAAFKKLNYYKPKVSYRKNAKFERFDDAKRFLMKTTTERLPEYAVYGKVTFRHKAKNYTLNVYQNIELVKKPGFQDHLFIPFNDKTNGDKTYGGGRFLDIAEDGKDEIIIDFNKAYNPYCAYNHKYSCPIPPESNNLKTKIKAGEKKYHK